jgi:hypothetical protein
MIKIIQSSPIHTGSTLLLNLIHGFISPNEEIHWDTHKLIHNFLITKTHDTNINEIEKKYPKYKLFFIMSERNDSKVKSEINNEYKKKTNVLVINYDKLLETNDNSIKNIIDYTFNEFNNFIPNELKQNKDDNLIKADMEKRIKIVNEQVELMKNRPFHEYDKFTGIHGSHRNRKPVSTSLKI